MRFSKSTSRGLTKTGWVCESTKPGRTTFPAQSISRTFLRFFFSQGSRSASLVVPTETIFPPRHKTAPFSIMPGSLRSEARRGPGLPEADCSVRSWPMLASNSGGGICLATFRDEATLKQFSSVKMPRQLPECRACYIIRHPAMRSGPMQSARVGKRGAIVVPAKLRKRFGIEEGSVVIAEETEERILIRPAMVVPVERYTPQRKAEFLLSNAVDEADYRQARKEVRKLGLDPDSIQHLRPE